MSQQQYLKRIERELQHLNKQIDLKIMRGEAYFKEARDHKLMLKKIRFIQRQSFFKRMFPSFSSL